MKKLDYSTLLLINPILLHNQTTNYLKSKTTKPKGIDDLITSKIEFFIDFNERYYSFLPLSINTILIAQKLNFIETNNNIIIPNKKEIEKFEFDSQELGNRANAIIEASQKLVELLKKESTRSLYLKLRVEI